MSFSEFELKRIDKWAQAYLARVRPPAHIRPQLDVGYRVQQNIVEIVEIRGMPDYMAIKLGLKVGEKTEQAVAQARFDAKKQTWRVYWRRANLDWAPYATAQVARFEDFLALVEKDEHHCFWG